MPQNQIWTTNELRPTTDVESNENANNRLWPLDEIDPNKSKFPCCIVWTPLPVVSWLAPYFGHVGICKEDGTVLDFSGSNFISEDNFSYGAVARYLQLDREKCCFPQNLSGHRCKRSYMHVEHGTGISWDDGLRLSIQCFHHKSYNIFTCNCYSYVANCLNRLAYNGSVTWNVLNVAGLILWRGRWVNPMAVVRSFFPFLAVMSIGIVMAGWSFVAGFAMLSLLFIGWFVLGTYCITKLMDT